MLKTDDSLFKEKWDQVYNQITRQKEGGGHWTFGHRERLEVKEIATFTVARNVALADKRESPFIIKAYQQKRVSFPFDHSQFSFLKINQNETIAYLNSEQTVLWFDSPEFPPFQHEIIINGTPIFKGSSLFLPKYAANLPQQLNKGIIDKALGLNRVLPFLLIGFNSQGGASSVNHLHFQLLDICSLNKQMVKIEEIQANHVKLMTDSEGHRLIVSYFQMFGALYFRFSCSQTQIHQERMRGLLAQMLSNLVELAQKETFPYHLIVTDSQTVFFVFRNFATSEISFGFLQYCGIIICKGEEEFHQIKEEEIARKFKDIELPQQAFEGLLTKASVLFSQYGK